MSTTVAAAYKITTGTADDDDDWSPKVKPRWRFSKAATRILEEFFGENPNPVQATIDDLAKKLHSPRRTVNTWFQNRRAKQRRIQKRLHQVQQQQQQQYPQAVYYISPTNNYGGLQVDANNSKLLPDPPSMLSGLGPYTASASCCHPIRRQSSLPILSVPAPQPTNYNWYCYSCYHFLLCHGVIPDTYCSLQALCGCAVPGTLPENSPLASHALALTE